MVILQKNKEHMDKELVQGKQGTMTIGNTPGNTRTMPDCRNPPERTQSPLAASQRSNGHSPMRQSQTHVLGPARAIQCHTISKPAWLLALLAHCRTMPRMIHSLFHNGTRGAMLAPRSKDHARKRNMRQT